MKDEVVEHLEDILREAFDIKEFTSGISFEQYSKDRLLKAGMERKLEIIGEALNRIRSIDEDSLEKIREYRNIISFRNILAHGYDIIEDKVVWGIIENDLDILIADVKYLLRK